jgi:hypothetical protein
MVSKSFVIYVSIVFQKVIKSYSQKMIPWYHTFIYTFALIKETSFENE